MPRLRRILTTTGTTLVLLVLTALPALAAAAGTKPDPDADPYVIGSLEQLVTTAIVGVVVAVIAWTLLPSRDAVEDDHH